MAILRNVVFILLVGLGLVGQSFAETIPATQSTVAKSTGKSSSYGAQYPTAFFADRASSCAYITPGVVADYPNAYLANMYNDACNYAYAPSVGAAQKGVQGTGLYCPSGTPSGGNCIVLSCPSGQNWTLQGSNCVRPDCVAPQTMQQDGTCGAPPNPCEAPSQQPPTYSWFKSTVGGPSVEGSYCNGTCTVALNPAPTGTAYNNGKEKIQRYEVVVTAAPCQSANMPVDTPSANTPPEPPKKPVCAPTEGVLTTSTGTIACVPPGVPTQSVPQVRKEKRVETFPDGSSKTIETTYTKDPVSQVQDTNQITVIAPATGGGAGQAGTPGTSSATGSSGTTSGGNPDPSGSDTADFCQKNANLQICKGDMNKEETQIQVRDYIKSLTDPSSTPYTALENAKQSTEVDAELKAETDKFEAIMNGTVDPAASSKSSWQAAMESGWFSAIPSSTCSPYTATIGGRTWNLDICPTAEKIATIAEYVMWFGLVIGVFVMFTGGAYVRNQ